MMVNLPIIAKSIVINKNTLTPHISRNDLSEPKKLPEIAL